LITVNTLLALSRWIDRINAWIGRLASGLVLVMIAVGCWNVVGRYVGQAVGTNLSSNALIETQWYLFSVVFLLGAAYTLLHNGHVRVDVLYTQWTPRQRARANLIGTLVFLLPFSVLILLFSWKWVLASWLIGEQSPDPGGLPRYPVKTLILLSFLTLVFQGISEAIKYWAFLARSDAPRAGGDA
jgi:TRAP-type mannitol/chloroaromatic compound transport system permease small subunit